MQTAWTFQYKYYKLMEVCVQTFLAPNFVAFSLAASKSSSCPTSAYIYWSIIDIYTKLFYATWLRFFFIFCFHTVRNGL